jgi:hypothetical protein
VKMQFKNPDPAFYLALADELRPERPDLARRYADLRRRREVLMRARDRSSGVRNNPLALAGFRPPLSLAGASPQVVTLGMELDLAGLPVALRRDGKGRHRGTTIDEAVALVRSKGRPDATEEQVVRWYGALMRRHRKISKHVKRNADEIAAAEKVMAAELLCREASPTLREASQAAVVYGTSRFFVTLGRDDLHVVLRDTEADFVVLSHLPGPGGPETGTARLTPPGLTLPALWGTGRGLACLRTDDLWKVVHTAGDSEMAVAIECLPGKWRAWPDATDMQSKAMTFDYGGSEE